MLDCTLLTCLLILSIVIEPHVYIITRVDELIDHTLSSLLILNFTSLQQVNETQQPNRLLDTS